MLGFLWVRANTTSLKRCRNCSVYYSAGVEAEEIKRLITSVNGLKRLNTQYSYSWCHCFGLSGKDIRKESFVLFLYFLIMGERNR